MVFKSNKELIYIEQNLKKLVISDIDRSIMTALKQRGFSDSRLANLLDVSEAQVRKVRHSLEVRPVLKESTLAPGNLIRQPHISIQHMKKRMSRIPAKIKKY